MKVASEILYWTSILFSVLSTGLYLFDNDALAFWFCYIAFSLALTSAMLLFLYVANETTAKEIADTVRSANPYPTFVFTEPSDAEKQAVSNLLAKNGISPDRIFGAFGREVWERACQQIEEDYE